ncbi:transposase family protein [Planococcus sp. APC 3900]|uniref:transposase family protein n=1 Tax=Planococcus sp. APC 3900 TaxID=3035191 RepID=UPI0025B32BC5|nr:transposase family protein [Planococcus sp. APC 3900]MDN3437270.1 transposase family protein [Planococcus sp. APC 3900]
MDRADQRLSAKWRTYWTFTLIYYKQTEEELFFIVEVQSSSALCPACRQISRRLHSRYCRKVDDLPLLDRQVHFQALLHKWFCDNSDCPMKVFTERLNWLQSYKRKTERLENVIEKIAFSTSCLTAEKVCQAMHIPVSHDALLRRVKAASFELTPPSFRRH